MPAPAFLQILSICFSQLSFSSINSRNWLVINYADDDSEFAQYGFSETLKQANKQASNTNVDKNISDNC